jgi:uncharacterized protein
VFGNRAGCVQSGTGGYATCDEGQRMRVLIFRGLMIATLALNGVAFAGPLEDGEAAYNRGDYETALQLMMPLAAKGDAAAQNYIGWMFENGQSVAKNYDAAVKWYRLAAGQGYASAQNNLGRMYEKGRGVPKDYHEAIKWYRLAEAQGAPALAQHNLGRMYENGWGVSIRRSDQVVSARCFTRRGIRAE